MIISLKKKVSLEEQKAVRKTEWDLSAKLLKDTPFSIIIRGVLAFLLVGGAGALLSVHLSVSPDHSYFLIGAVMCLLGAVVILSGVVTNFIKSRRVLKVYYKRVEALFEKEYADIGSADEVELIITDDSVKVTYIKCATKEIVKICSCAISEVKANEFDRFISLDFNRLDVFSFATSEIDSSKLDALRDLLSKKANSYTSIEKGTLGKYTLENLKIK